MGNFYLRAINKKSQRLVVILVKSSFKIFDKVKIAEKQLFVKKTTNL